MIEITPGLYRIAMPMQSYLETVNYYLIKDSTSAYLVDTGIADFEAMESLQRSLGQVGLRLEDLSGVMLTHGHRDHAGLAAQLRDDYRIPIWMHPAEAKFLLERASQSPDGRSSIANWLDDQGVTPKLVCAIESAYSGTVLPFSPIPFQPLVEGAELRVGSMTWQLIWTPGHTPGHICLWEHRLGLLISGDHLLPHDTPNISLVPGARNDPLGDYLAGLERIGELSPNLILPGHGEPFMGLHDHVIRVQSHHDQRIADIILAMDRGAESSFEIASAIPWVRGRKRLSDLAPSDQRLALGETVAHLKYLEGQGRLIRGDDGRWLC